MINLCKKRNRSICYPGSVLAYVLVIMTVVVIILTSIIGYVVSQLRFSDNRIEREKAFQVAEAGIYYYRWYLSHATDGMNTQQLDGFWYGGTALGVSSDYTADYKDPETGEVVGQYTLHVDRPDHSSTITWVTSVGKVVNSSSIQRTVKVRLRRPSWSEYMFLSNSFMNFGSDAEVWGKVYSSGGIRFDGIAHDTVSSLVPSFNDPTWGGNRLQFGVHTTKNPADPNAPSYPWPAGTVPNRPGVFMGGREFPVPEISFTGVTTDLANMKTQAQGGNGKYFDASGLGRRINLKSDGTYDVCTVSTANNNTHTIGRYLKTSGSGTCTSCSGTCLSNYPIPDGGVIFVENNAWVEGTINNKKLTIVAANLSGGGNDKDIYIGISNSSLRYAAYNCNNMLGLVAQQDVRVLNDCPSNFTVDATLLAQKGTVGIVNGMGGKYTLTFNGAIASYLQPFFQSGNSGFADRKYNFNNNLLYCPPPYFPTGTEYSIDLWEEI